MIGAFQSDPSLKKQAVDDALAAVDPGWINVATNEERLLCAQKFGLAPHLITLISVASNAPYWDGSKEFVADCLENIPLGADSEKIARQWATSLWSGVEYAVEPNLVGATVYDPAAAVFKAARTSTVALVPRQKWRQMRSEIARMTDLVEPALAYANVAAALAWDANSTPGVYADVWKAWQEAIRIEHDALHGVDQDVQQKVLGLYRDAAVEAHAIVSPLFGGSLETEEALTAQREQITKIIDASELASVVEALMKHWEASAVHISAARSYGLSTILSACKTA